MQVCHIDGNRLNSRADNLMHGTARENNSHKLGHGTAQIGEAHPMAKLSNEDVIFVRTSGLSIPELSARFGISDASVSACQTGRTYKNVPMSRKPTVDIIPWSDADDARMISLWESGLTMASVAKEMGRTRVSCHARAAKIKKKTPERLAFLKRRPPYRKVYPDTLVREGQA